MSGYGFLPLVTAGVDRGKIAGGFKRPMIQRTDGDAGVDAFLACASMERDASRARFFALVTRHYISHNEAEEAAREGGWIDGDYRGEE